MKKSIALLGTLLALAGAHADTLPAGTLVTGVLAGTSSTLLGLDAKFADVPGSNVTAVSAGELEYITGDVALQVDLLPDGTLTFWNNTSELNLPGSYSFSFSFASPVSLSGITLADTSQLASGSSISVQWLGAQQVSVSFSNLTFTEDWGSFSVALAAAPVPEPSSYALLAAGLGLLAVRRARSAKA